MNADPAKERVLARLRLVLAEGLGPVLSARLEAAFGSPESAAEATIAQLEKIDGIGSRSARKIRAGLDRADPEAAWERAQRGGVDLLTIDADAYPPALRHIHDPPPVLFVRGTITPEDTLGLAIVGSRRCTAYGREQADRFGALCAEAGLTIVSGGAVGIDAAAHHAAMRAGGRTHAVLGCGLGHCYPPEHRDLYHQIAEGGGAVISEFPFDAPPAAEHFPRRNRIISGMALGVLVIEADIRSGAMITARLACEDHNREVMAVPGRLDSRTSAGCHRMIREGWATLVTSPGEVLECLGETGRHLRASVAHRQQVDTPIADPLDAGQAAVLNAVDKEGVSFDALCQKTGKNAGAIQAAVTQLEILGLVRRLGANRIARC